MEAGGRQGGSKFGLGSRFFDTPRFIPACALFFHSTRKRDWGLSMRDSESILGAFHPTEPEEMFG